MLQVHEIQFLLSIFMLHFKQWRTCGVSAHTNNTNISFVSFYIGICFSSTKTKFILLNNAIGSTFRSWRTKLLVYLAKCGWVFVISFCRFFFLCFQGRNGEIKGRSAVASRYRKFSQKERVLSVPSRFGVGHSIRNYYLLYGSCNY